MSCDVLNILYFVYIKDVYISL